MEDTAKSVTISKTKPAKNTQNLVNCPICEEDIHDATSNTKGEDYVYCEGNCKTWLHRRCAGLSKHNFKLVIESNAPYLCTHCRLTEAEKKIEETNLQLQKLFSEFNGKLRAAHPVGDEHDCSLDPSATGTETDSAEDCGGILETDYGQNEGQRCIPVGVLMQFCRGVLRMRMKRSDETYGHASGFFVELEGSHWIITTCHTLLDKNDGELMREGKHKDIHDLFGKMTMNLQSCTFFLPDEQFKLTQLEEPLDAIVPDVRHLVEDPENDIVAICCKNPRDFGASTFSIKLEAMREILPLQEGHNLTIVHCPRKLATSRAWDNAAINHHVQYSSGKIKELEPQGRPRAIYYDMVTYKGSSGSPVFFAGRSGIVVIGIHRRYHDGDNQCSYLSEVFIKHMRNNMKRMK